MKRITALPLLATLLAGCGTTATPQPPSAEPPPGLSVSLGQWRSDEAAHIMQVAVRNTTETPVHFIDAQLVTPSFATLAPQNTEITVKKTDRTDLPIPYGRANCTPGRLPDLQPATVVAHLRVGTEPTPRKVVFDLPHPDPLLARLLRDECSEHLIKQAADITFGPEWKRAGDTMRATLTLTRRGPGTVTVHRIDGTTHYIAAPVTPGEPIAELDAGAPRTQVDIQLTPGRCDPHAFAEAKKAFLFPVRASLDGGEQRVVIVTPPKEIQDRLVHYALDVCGLPTS